MAENVNTEVQEDKDEALEYWAGFFFYYFNVVGCSYLAVDDELVCSDYLEVE